MIVTYKEYEIVSTTMKLRDDEKWTTSVTIVRHHNSHSNRLPFSSESTFDTEKEAEYNSIKFGKEIIDGKHHGLSVDKL